MPSPRWRTGRASTLADGASYSPDRYDALVWALSELAVKDEPGLLTAYRNEVARRAAAKAAGQG